MRSFQAPAAINGCHEHSRMSHSGLGFHLCRIDWHKGGGASLVAQQLSSRALLQQPRVSRFGPQVLTYIHTAYQAMLWQASHV